MSATANFSRADALGELSAILQWIAWVGVRGEGRPFIYPSGAVGTEVLKAKDKLYKLPINPHTGGPGKTDDPRTWGTHREAIAAVGRWDLSGPGFVFRRDDRYGGVDLDNCRHPQTGVIAPWAQKIIDALNSYTEVSPTETGVKIYLAGKLAADQGNQFAFGGHGGKVEMFSHGRYFAFTGKHVAGTPATIEDRQTELLELQVRLRQTTRRNTAATLSPAPAATLSISEPEIVDRARHARDGAAFSSLWSGQWEGNGYPSQSEADLALCRKLAFWTGRDPARMDSLFRQSGLMREKWLRDDYRERTIAEACRSTAETFSPRPQRRPQVQGATQQKTASAAAQQRTKPPVNLLVQIHRDHGNAARLIKMHGQDLRYCFGFKKWLVWDGRRWRLDESERSRDLLKLTMVEFLRQAVGSGNEPAQKFAKESFDTKRITNALREAQSGLSIMPAELDRHPFLLNFLNGTVDLRTGQLMSHSREHFITKLVHHNYNPDAEAPTFEAFLARIMGIDPDASIGQLERGQHLIGYLHKALGYSLTGVTIEKAVFLLHGSGDNGKSTLLSLFLELLEEYAVLLQIDTLMVRPESNNTQADLADLRGARFVMTSETEEGQRLAEGKLKRITQGMGKIKATRKYENPIEFNESHKLWIDANHLPQVRGTDNAIWNRLHPIPFEVTIPAGDQDKELRGKLLAEAEGILAWAVKGALRWHSERLGKPPEVEQFSATWRAESNQVGRFVDACCVRARSAQARARPLFQAYRKWSDEVGERSLSETIFSKCLKNQGFKPGHDERGNYYDGIGQKTHTEGT